MESADFNNFLHRLKDRLNKEIPETSHRSSDVFIAKDGKGYLIQSAHNLLTASEILAVVGSFTGASLTISLIPDQGVEVKMMYYNVSVQQLQKRFNLSTESLYYVTHNVDPDVVVRKFSPHFR